MKLSVSVSLVVVLMCGRSYAAEEKKIEISKEDREYLEMFVGEWDQTIEEEGKPTVEVISISEMGNSNYCNVFQSPNATGLFVWAGKPGRFVELVSFDGGTYGTVRWKRKSATHAVANGRGISENGQLSAVKLFEEIIDRDKFIIKVERRLGEKKLPDIIITRTRRK